jgi:hypothetical protein
MHVIIEWRRRYDHIGWSVGFCKHCGQIEAARVEDVVEVVSIWFIPISSTRVGLTAHCDFCSRSIDATLPPPIVTDAWTPADGLPALFARLSLFVPPLGAEVSSETRLRSLLKSTKKAAKLANVTFAQFWPGALCGIVLGAVLGPIFASNLWERRIPGGPDLQGATMAGFFLGAVVFGLAGAILNAMLCRGRIAFARLSAAYEKYTFDVRKLDDLAIDYGGPVRRAARRLRDESQAR